MDPAVAAALITTPTAVLASAAAYAAGRAQARSAHRGPVDAVRRQHQRDAYAELSRAALSYLSSTRSVMLFVRQVHDVRLPDDVTSGVRYRLGRSFIRPGTRRDDLAHDLAPDVIPPDVDHTLVLLEMLSPTWQQDIRDANQLDDLLRAASVVTLEGPDHLAELAGQLRDQAISVQRCWHEAAVTPFTRLRQQETEQDPNDMYVRLKETVEEFTRAARTHLNNH
ncbi:hypothetical protein [Streptomyces justiciae]|uniref:hypothetical protein n=1 Tax=Streptomyces justiciae TaxID=2780140 RepID=UPI002118A0EA|nr:hypothetical protein [Streptomyces justiciae]MCW8382430.1 hypothetical protein [Streptomyces justiciae]